jgi:indolepyruvate ferredoxin oxidoreductase
LSGDILQAAAARHLAKIRPGHTVVVDPELTPTASMLQGGSTPPDIEALKAAITERAAPVSPALDSSATTESSAARVAFVEAKRIAEAVFSDHPMANVVLAGTAYQLGGLPGSVDDVSQAMSRQGKSAAVNHEAFEWGRWAVHDPGTVEAALRGPASSATASPFEPSARSLTVAGQLMSSAGLPSDLRDLLTRPDGAGGRLSGRAAGTAIPRAGGAGGAWRRWRARMVAGAGQAAVDDDGVGML